MARITKLGLISLCAVGVLAAAAITIAGDLDPPVGSVAPTMKDLDTIEPRIPIGDDTTPGDANWVYRITQPGSYYLTSDVVGVAGKGGLEIIANDVKLDLMGFTFRGVTDSTKGICVGASVSGIQIVNGSIRGWGEDGIDAEIPVSSVYHDLHISLNGGIGLYAGPSSVVERCTAESNGEWGIFAEEGCHIANCTAFLNGQDGFRLSGSSAVSGCASANNEGDGFTGTGSFANCTATSNAQDGFNVLGGTITNCEARGNQECGMFIRSVIISESRATSNNQDGILALEMCTVRNNLCRSNGGGDVGDGAGIRVTMSDNRIEGNNLLDADRGIEVDAPGNIIIRNTCSGNTTNFDFVAGNVYGPIIDRTVPASPAVLGNSAPDASGTDHPWANFAY